jgi:hypothetical protein
VAGSSHALWLSKVAPDVQGRVFSVRRMISMGTPALAYAIAGPLADKVFEPLLLAGGPLAGSVGKIVGVGPGRGIGLFMMGMGACLIAAAIVGYLYPRLRLMESEIPDPVVAPAAA